MRRVGKISQNLEDYLENIFDTIRENGIAKISDIAKRKDVKMSSVHDAVKRLVKEGLVSHDLYKNINLTSSGAALAGELSRRHEVIKAFLAEVLEVSSRIAEKDACAIEHYVHPETIRKLIQYVDGQKR